MFIPGLDLQIAPAISDDTPELLAMGLRTEVGGRHFLWLSCKTAGFLFPSGDRIVTLPAVEHIPLYVADKSETLDFRDPRVHEEIGVFY